MEKTKCEHGKGIPIFPCMDCFIILKNKIKEQARQEAIKEVLDKIELQLWISVDSFPHDYHMKKQVWRDIRCAYLSEVVKK